MPVPRLKRLPRLLLLAVVLALSVPLLAPASPVHAEDGVSTGDTVVGTLVRAWSEQKTPDVAAEQGQDGPLTFVRKADGQAVRLPTPAVQHLPRGATVAVKVGKEVVDAATTKDGLDPARQVLAATVVAPAPEPAAPAPSPGTGAATNHVTVVMTVPAGGTRDSTTLQQVVDMVNGPVAAFWSQQSGGAIQIDVTGQVDWFQATADCSNPYALWSQAAQKAGWSGVPAST